MERLKNITIIFLLAVGLPASAAPAKSASVLLQEGLYAEEIEGDLDAAIKIYERVIAEAKKTQRAAAQATYRIGMCYLKKGEKGKAAGQFRDLIEKFPEHESLVAKAQEHLAKLKPPITITGGFGPARERIVNDDGVGKNFMLDLDTGELFSASDARGKSKSLEDFIVEEGIDVVGETKPSVRGLMGVDMIVIPIANERWDISVNDVIESVLLGRPGRPVVMSGKGQLPATFIFKTKQGNMGVLQILEVEAGQAPRHVRIRYKMIEKPMRTVSFGGFRLEEPVPLDELIKSGKVPAFKTQIYDNTGLDLETGVVAPLKDDWPALFDVTWDNDGGGALMINTKSSVRFLALGAAEKWEDAISMARNTLAVLRTSTARGIFAGQSKFVAILTSEGNLAVIQIGRYDQEKGTIYWWLEKLPAYSFGPVFERIIHSEETGKPFFFDLDTAKAFSPPPGLTRYSPEREVIEWSATKGIDFVNSRGHLELVEMTTVKVESDMWESATPAEIKDALLKGSTQNFLPTRSKDYTISSPITYVFKTCEGGIGILQILEKKDNNLRIRYKMLQERAKTVAGGWRIVFLPDADDVIQQGKVAVVLDLTTGKMLPGNKDKQYFNKLNKGDVAYFDDEGKDLLVCFRGAKITRKTANGKYSDTPDQSHTDNTTHIYIIKKTPAEWTITTKEGDIYELKVLSLDNDQAKIKYRKMFRYKMLQGETAQLSVSSHKVFLPECDTTVYDLLDLASSRIINSEPGGEVLDLSKPDGKGNLYFDKAKGQLWLVGLRGTRMRLRSGGELLSSEPDFISRGIAAYYLLGEIPCQYLVTTAQGDKYELKVLSVEMGDRPGVHIEYWKSAESPGAFAVAMPVRGDAAKAMELLSGLKALMAGVVGAVESDDPNTALLLLDKLIAQSKQFKSTVKDTSVEAAVKAGLELLDPLRDALEKKQMGRVKSLLAALNQMGPAIESALEKEAAKQEIAARHRKHVVDATAEMGWDLRTIEKAERGGDLRKSERFDKAKEVFKKALEMDPTNASALKGLAVTCMERKEYGEAIKYYEMWLKAEPNNKDAKAGLEKAKAAKQQ